MSKGVLRRSKSVCLTKSWKESALEKLEEGAIEQELFQSLTMQLKLKVKSARFIDWCFYIRGIP